MNAQPTPVSYSLIQIVLHWTIALLVLWNLFVSEEPGRNGAVGFLEQTHVWFGIAILVLVALRIVLRLTRGVPAPVETNELQALAAHITHLLFYILLIFMPVTGILTYYFGLPLGGIHHLGEPVFIVLIAVHVLATLWHQFVKRDNIISRMWFSTTG